MHRLDQVADVQDADDVVQRVAIDGVARVRRLEHRLQRLLRRQRDRDRHHLGAGHHHVGDFLVGEVEDLVEHLLFLVLDLSLLRRRAEEHAQLGLGVRLVLGARWLEAERAQDQRGRFLEHPDQRPEDEKEPVDGRRQRERGALGMAERDPLRHELADHDVQVRDDEQSDDHGEDGGHHRVEMVREHLFAESTDGERGDRHPELHGRDEARRIARDPQHGTRAAVALVLQLHDPRAARGDEAVLGRHEERVQEHQPEQGQHLQEKGHRSWRPSGARVLGGRSSSTQISGRSIAAGWTDRTGVRIISDACLLPRRALQGGAQPRQGHALRMVAESVHGLRAPLHVLLRARVRAARRPPLRRPLRHVDQGEAEHRRGAAGASCSAPARATKGSRSGPPRIPTSRRRAVTGSRARASRCCATSASRSRSSRAGR